MSSFTRLTCEVSVDWNRTRDTKRVDQSTASLITDRAKEVRGGVGPCKTGVGGTNRTLVALRLMNTSGLMNAGSRSPEYLPTSSLPSSHALAPSSSGTSCIPLISGSGRRDMFSRRTLSYLLLISESHNPVLNVCDRLIRSVLVRQEVALHFRGRDLPTGNPACKDGSKTVQLFF